MNHPFEIFDVGNKFLMFRQTWNKRKGMTKEQAKAAYVAMTGDILQRITRPQPELDRLKALLNSYPILSGQTFEDIYVYISILIRKDPGSIDGDLSKQSQEVL